MKSSSSMFAAFGRHRRPSAIRLWHRMCSLDGRALVSQLLSKYPLVMVEKRSCPYCNRARGVLSQYQLKSDASHILDIQDREDGPEIQDYLKGISQSRTVPQIFVGGRFIGGATDLEKLHSTGKLESILKENQIIEK